MTLEVANKHRIQYIDLAKGICIMLVVMYHTFNAFGIREYPAADALRVFRMPLYFFLSGLFFSPYEGYVGFLKRKINKLLIPFIAFYLLTVVPFEYIVKGGFSEQGIQPFYYCFIEVWHTNTPLWFLLCLFVLNNVFYVVYMFAKMLTEKYAVALISVLSLLIGAVGFYLGHYGVNLYCYLDSAFTALPFFVAGFLFRRYTGILYPQKYDKYNWVFIIISICLLLWLGQYENFRTQEYATNVLTMYVCGLAGTLSVLFLSKYIGYLPFVSYCGRYSIIILVTHRQLVWVFCEVSKWVTNNQWIAIPAVFIVVMLICSSLIYPMRTYLGHITAQKDVIPVGK